MTITTEAEARRGNPAIRVRVSVYATSGEVTRMMQELCALNETLGGNGYVDFESASLVLQEQASHPWHKTEEIL